MRSWRVTTLRFAVSVFLVAALGGGAWAQNHDLEMAPAPNITAAANGANWHSPDLKLGADFGDASVQDIVRRGADTPIFAKFYINGILDGSITSPLEIYFHYRNALVGDTPPAISDPSWVSIGSLTVPYNAAEPFFITKTWPDDFPSVVNKSISWTPPLTGNLFHVRAQVVYPGETPATPPAASTDEDDADNVAISLYESILGVRDVDLVIVHDVSGSMITNTYAGDTYLAHAKARAKAFVTMMTASHKIGVVAFGGCLAGNTADIWTVPASPLSPANWLNKALARTAIEVNVTVPNAGCLTPLGVGVQRAIQILSAEPASPTRKRTILLLSDGFENSGTPRACDGANPASPCLGTGLLAVLQANDIRVFSIALGASAAANCLDCVATQSGGSWYSPAGPGIVLAQVYADMQQAYSADDLYRSDVGVSGGGDDEYQTFFEGADDVLYFGLQTDRLDAELDLQLRPPGGGWTAPGVLPNASVERDRGYVIVRVENPTDGDWGYRVVGEPGEAYLVTVRSDRVATRLTVDLDSRGFVGSPIRVRADLSHLGEPIDGAQLVAVVQAPEVSFETLLREYGRKILADPDQLPYDPDLREKARDLSARALFLKSLEKRGVDARRLRPTQTFEVPLRQVEAGVYEGYVEKDTRIAGEYKVTVSYSSEKADRTWTESVRLQPGKLDPGRSFAELIPRTPTWVLRIYPVDAFGNALVSQEALSKLEVKIEGGEPLFKPSVAFDSAIGQQVEGKQPVLRYVAIAGQEIPIRDQHEEAKSSGDR